MNRTKNWRIKSCIWRLKEGKQREEEERKPRRRQKKNLGSKN